MSPDPLTASASVYDPQSWNRYVYARNNPLRYNDPLGLFASPSYYCDDDTDACLNDEQRRILENSNIKIGKETLSGEALWNALGDKDESLREVLQNAFVNINDKLASRGHLGEISSLAGIDADRIYANVSADLESSLSIGYTRVPGHKSPYDGNSYKNTDGIFGNIQMSFSRDGRMADIDIDIGNAANGILGGAIHFGEVLYNKATGKNTNQDIIRKILIQNPKVMITPSTDPIWNRR